MKPPGRVNASADCGARGHARRPGSPGKASSRSGQACPSCLTAELREACTARRAARLLVRRAGGKLYAAPPASSPRVPPAKALRRTASQARHLRSTQLIWAAVQRDSRPLELHSRRKLRTFPSLRSRLPARSHALPAPSIMPRSLLEIVPHWHRLHSGRATCSCGFPPETPQPAVRPCCSRSAARATALSLAARPPAHKVLGRHSCVPITRRACEGTEASGSLDDLAGGDEAKMALTTASFQSND